MGFALLIIIAVLEVGGLIAFMFYSIQTGRSKVSKGLKDLNRFKDERNELDQKLRGMYGALVDLAEARSKVKESKSFEDALKAERGRVTITQAELETVETRLRELEEIERELEASSIETNEELKVLKARQEELAKKNGSLKSQLDVTTQQMDMIISEIQLSAAQQEALNQIKTELVMTQQRIDILMLQIEQGNEQYFILKHRFDALDIEYAQLYEKFSDAEAAAGNSGGGN
jgi:chromosome segregation ATPase